MNSSYSEPINTAVFHICCTINLMQGLLELRDFIFYKYFCLVLGLKSRISKKIVKGLVRKPDFKLFPYKARVKPVRKITTITARNRCYRVFKLDMIYFKHLLGHQKCTFSHKNGICTLMRCGHLTYDTWIWLKMDIFEAKFVS